MVNETTHISVFDGAPPDFEHYGLIDGYEQLVCLADTNTLRDCLPLLMQPLSHKMIHILSMQAGEEHKSLASAETLWRELTRIKIGRQALLMCLGGGVVTDLGGFVASTYLRGIDCLNIPTSLLGMVDAAVGGKTGINFAGKKNYIGTFSHPRAIWIFPVFLRTLPGAEFVHGKAEILKHGLIADADMVGAAGEWLSSDSIQDLLPLIRRSVEIKSKIVATDPEEENTRRLLNFGHTLGHALESLYMMRGEVIPHGQAVAAGMVMEAYISMRVFRHSPQWLDKIATVIRANVSPVPIAPGEGDELINLLQYDKKRHAGSVGFTLLENIGKGSVNHDVDTGLIAESIAFYCENFSSVIQS